MDCESNESVYNNFVMSSEGEGMECGVIERAKCNSLQWFGYIEGKLKK